MTWWILSNIEFPCGFATVAHLALIPYSFLIGPFLNTWPWTSFPRSYVIILELGYLHTHFCYTRFDIVSAYLSLYRTISNHPVTGYIIVKAFSIRGSLWPSLIILYGLIRSTVNLSYGMVSTSLVGNFPYLNFCFLSFWQVLQTFMWVRISSLNWGH